jgi:hypothetical protein
MHMKKIWKKNFETKKSIIAKMIIRCRGIFLTLNMAHTYSLCLVLKNTGQCMYVIT